MPSDSEHGMDGWAFTAEDTGWKLDRRVPDTPSLKWSDAGDESGLRFESRGLDLLTRAFDAGTGPFEFAADIAVSAGTGWRSYMNDGDDARTGAGVHVTLTSAPIDEMSEEDWAVVFSVTGAGVATDVRRGGARSAATGGDPGETVGGKHQLVSAPDNPHYSVQWPDDDLAGQRVRLHARRDDEDQIHLTIYHADGAAGPWWEARVELNADLREVPLDRVTIHTGREVPPGENWVAADPRQEVGVREGVVRDVAARSLKGDDPELNEPFPPARVESPEGWTPDPTFLDEGTVSALRTKWEDPVFDDWREMLLSQDPGQPGDVTGTGGVENDVWALVFLSYLDSGNREGHLDALQEWLTVLTGVTDRLPAEEPGAPGHRRQHLDIVQFETHKMASLALVHDALADELDAARLGRIRHRLLRGLRLYERKIEEDAWWYAANPSNTIGVGGGSNGLAAIVMREFVPNLAEDAIEDAVEQITDTYTAVGPDGACVEGTLYWDYGMHYPILFGWGLRQADGDDRGLLGLDRLRNAHQYVETVLGGNDQLIPFNDTQPRLTGALNCTAADAEFGRPLLRWMADHLAERYNDAEEPGWARARPTIAFGAFLFREHEPPPGAFPGVPDLQWLEYNNEGVMRSDGSAYEPGLVTGVKGVGEVTSHHAQEDAGSFVVYANGERLLLDPGYGNDAARDHSLPLVGDPDVAALDPDATAPIKATGIEGERRTLAVDATAAYADGATGAEAAVERVCRVFVQAGADALVVLDDVQVTGDIPTVTVQYQSAHPVKTPDSRTAVVSGEATDLRIDAFGPDLDVTVERGSFERDWTYVERGIGWHRISGAYTVDTARPLLSVLQPAGPGETASRPAVTYGDGRIKVTVEGTDPIAFACDGSGWRSTLESSVDSG